MDIKRKIASFTLLGEFIAQFGPDKNTSAKKEVILLNETLYTPFSDLIPSLSAYNGWFTEENVRFALSSIARNLTCTKLENWLQKYPAFNDTLKRIAVILAGNIPAVGFHDFLAVLLSGNRFLGKTSSGDQHLLPFFARVLNEIDGDWGKRISFTDGRIENPDAVIATGSDNSSRYFEYYFGKYPHIIRKNRNSVAVLAGNESKEDLKKAGHDVFRYFGLGCRNISKIFVPKGYDFNLFFDSLYDYHGIIHTSKYANNYEYNRTVYLMNSVKLLDNNFILLKEDQGLSSPVGVLYYEYYDDVKEVEERINTDTSLLQCIISASPIKNAIPFGSSQEPELGDYADGVDTLKFLSELNGSGTGIFNPSVVNIQ